MSHEPGAELTVDRRARPHAQPVRHRDVLAIAVPIMFSNATTPLVGYVDTVVIGQSGSATLIGAVAIASNIFNYIYWIFGFLRMGTTGFTAQAMGAEAWDEVAALLGRGLLIAVALGCMLVVLQGLLGPFLLNLMGASPAVKEAALVYFQIRIWGAPAALANFALVGWFIGLGRADIAFYLQLLLNLTNMVVAVVLVEFAGFGVAGVGIAVLAAELLAAGIGLWVAFRISSERRARLVLAHVLDPVRLKKFFAVNGDIMIRTLCLMLAFGFFTAQGARAGDLTLAVNALLFSIAMICTYLLDGYAFAAETFVGRAIGRKSRKEFDAAVKMSTLWAAITALGLSVLTYGAGSWMVEFATPSVEVREAARSFLIWAALVPIFGVWCFQLDGIFIGATQSAEMRNMMIVSLIIYLIAAAILPGLLGNDGLWLALFTFFVVRAATLAWRLPVIRARIFP